MVSVSLCNNRYSSRVPVRRGNNAWRRKFCRETTQAIFLKKKKKNPLLVIKEIGFFFSFFLFQNFSKYRVNGFDLVYYYKVARHKYSGNYTGNYTPMRYRVVFSFFLFYLRIDIFPFIGNSYIYINRGKNNSRNNFAR